MASIYSALFEGLKSVRIERIPARHRARFQLERLDRLRQISSFAASAYVTPLFLIFIVADLLYYREWLAHFVAIRILTVVGIVLTNRLVQKAAALEHVERLCTFFIILCAMPINAMVMFINDPGSPYYAGLTLVLIGMSSGFRFTWKYYFINLASIVGPYTIFGFFARAESEVLYALNIFFLFSTILISSVSRAFHENLYITEFLSRVGLESEVESRGKVIEIKTKESVLLESMGRQFSPQVVSAIKKGQIEISKGVHRARICAIFVDIVNSTERVTRIDKDKVNKVIELFMGDTIPTLLKYDITIDKFLGDGVLAFANDPIQYKDYTQRVINAALEIREKIKARQYLYENYWLNEFKIRIGIADGFANVGFYGNNKYYHSYTAIGPVINLASRLCGAAEPGQILAHYDVVEQLDIEKYDYTFVGKKTLKGFDDDIIKTYSIGGLKDVQKDILSQDIENCPACGSMMFLDNDDRGFFVFKCRQCGTILGNSEGDGSQGSQAA